MDNCDSDWWLVDWTGGIRRDGGVGETLVGDLQLRRNTLLTCTVLVHVTCLSL
jgi:hypothetical protein